MSTEFANPTVSGNDLIVTVEGTYVTMKAVDSRRPEAITEAGKDNTNWPEDGWKAAGWNLGSNNNQSKSAINFYTVYGTGVPFISFAGKEKYTDGEPQGVYHPDFDGNEKDGNGAGINGWTYYNPDGSLGLPKCGEYLEITAKAKGMLKIGFWGMKNTGRSLYIVDKETQKALALDKFKVEGYINGIEVPTDEPVIDPETGQQQLDNQEQPMWVKKMKFFPSIKVNDDYSIGDTNYLVEETGETKNLLGQHKYGWFVFDTEADKTYLIFGNNWQFGIQGYKFFKDATIDEYQPEDPSGIETIKTVAAKTNAPLFNLAGQKVTKSYKGVVIQNGRKMVLK